MIIGIVGKSGCGKNYISETLFSEFKHFDLDKYGHKYLETHVDQIENLFGSSVINNGRVDRSLLGKIVFADPEKMKVLEEFSHAWIDNEVEQDMKQYENVILNGAVLNKGKSLSICDKVYWIESPLIIRFFRLLRRDKSIYKVIRRIWGQRDITHKLYPEADILYN